jgi:hypothetical protein
MFRWSEIMRTEIQHKRISFETYEEAERYLKDNYCGHGLLTQSGNIYYFELYSILVLKKHKVFKKNPYNYKLYGFQNE